jgi:hypothetical protein
MLRALVGRSDIEFLTVVQDLAFGPSLELDVLSVKLNLLSGFLCDDDSFAEP